MTPEANNELKKEIVRLTDQSILDVLDIIMLDDEQVVLENVSGVVQELVRNSPMTALALLKVVSLLVTKSKQSFLIANPDVEVDKADVSADILALLMDANARFAERFL